MYSSHDGFTKTLFTIFIIIFVLALIAILAQWIFTAFIAVKVIENPSGVAEGAGKIVGTFLDAVKGAAK